MQFVDGAVFFPESSLLCMADLHLGYEAELRARGVHVPSTEFSLLTKRIAKILGKTRPEIIVLNGDVKHTFGALTPSEWRSARALMELFIGKKVIIVQGNHDAQLGPLAEKLDLTYVKLFHIEDILFCHGDSLPDKKELEGVKRIVIGHQHPAVCLHKGMRSEVYKCYLKGTWNGKELVVLPSMLSLTQGTDLLSEKIISPFLVGNIDDFFVHVIENEEILAFGTLADVKRLNQS